MPELHSMSNMPPNTLLLLLRAHPPVHPSRHLALKEASALIRREIYSYRTGTGRYYHARFRQPHLATALKIVTSRLLQTDAASVSVALLKGFDLSSPAVRSRVLGLADGDDALSPMHISDYTEHRLEFQRQNFREQGKEHAFRLKWLECELRSVKRPVT